MRADFGLAQAVVAGSRTDVHCLVASFPYSNMRYAVALPGRERGVRVRGAARGVRAHRRRAAGAGARTTPPARRTGSRGAGSWWWKCSRGSSRITGSRPGVRDPGAGNEKGGAGERGRVPAPQRDGAVAERRVACAAGGGSCSPGATGSPRIPITARASRSGTCVFMALVLFSWVVARR